MYAAYKYGHQRSRGPSSVTAARSLQPGPWVDGLTVGTDLEVQVWPRGVARGADLADVLALLDLLAGIHHQTGLMRIHGADLLAVDLAVVDNHHVSVCGVELGLHDSAGVGRPNPAIAHAEIGSGVQLGVSKYGVEASTELRGDRPIPRTDELTRALARA